MSKSKIIALITIFLDTLGFTIMIPAIPGLALEYNVTYTMITLGSTFYALCGLFSTPILGLLSDKYGRRPIMLISMIGSILCYLSIALSHSIRMYIIGMMINGITAGNIGTAQSILSDVSKDQKDRTKNLGLFGIIFGISFIIGPVVGALTLKLGSHGPFRASAILCTINVISALFFLKETHTKREEHNHLKIDIIHIFKDIIIGKERVYYLVFFLVMLGILTYQNTFLLYLNQRFNIPGNVGGMILGSFGIVMILNQAFMMNNLRLKLNTKKALKISFIGFIICYSLAATFPYKRLTIVVIGLSSFFLGAFRPIMQNLILGENKNVGLINGNMLNLVNIGSIFGPIIGGLLLDIHIPPFGLSAILIAISYVVYVYYAKHKISH